ncbi:type VII secretion integral membrane protein EccD [Actinokineospora sp. UTMC 2448]|uniref:type VII secretion integral membrane protein EccD n=1 Tax=Actinokineospora sp. UTMC 2448 TaxID=2268449 RepID=UPI00216462A5|nr:type VII secretion integral membrane protein EccD [Actinokineospora sp. UTMC 2448]UVS79633.1 type VII secretion integral membrane protein EccD [Actinokineospora sp. UTMC 2448]
MTGTGLVRITVTAPHRSIDLALPDASPIAEILPGLLVHAGERGADNGGWTLRRGDGTPLDLGRTLGRHGVRDGEVLHLVPRRVEWPEPEYDDLVDAIATSSGRAGRTWGPRHTRAAGLAAGGALMAVGLGAVLASGPSWTGAALWSLGLAALLLVGGACLARAVGDAGAGAVPAGIALPYAFAGGALVYAGESPIGDLGAPHLLSGCAAVVLVAVLGHIAVAACPVLFVAAATAGLFGVAGAWLSTTDALAAHDAAAVVAGLLLAFSPMAASAAIRLSRVPMPVLPRTTADLVRDTPQPPRDAVHAAVVRADAMLTGIVVAVGVVSAACQVLLTIRGGTAATVFVALLAVGFLLRARLYPVLWQRAALLTAGLVGLGCLALGPLPALGALLVAGPVAVLVGAAALAVGLVRSRRAAGPFLGRYAEILEVVVVLAVVPVGCWVLDLYSSARGLGG